MKSINEYLIEEASKDHSSNKTKAIQEIVDALRKSLDHYDLPTRKFIWDKLTNEKGTELMAKIVKNPKTYLSNSEFTKLVQKH